YIEEKRDMLMSKFEVLCVTMHQKDFSKIQEMNIHTDVVFANQADLTRFEEYNFENHRARMITTNTRGVGINRNLALLYAQGEICLFADDDVVYKEDMESLVLSEFDDHPDADIIIFHYDTNSDRKVKKNSKVKKVSRFSRMPWGTFRVAFRLKELKKANIWFTTLFGGGCLFPSGEDSMWLTEARRNGLTMYVSDKTIGTVTHETSTWFTGYDEKFYFGKGAFYQGARPKFIRLWMRYFALRTRGWGNLSYSEKIKWMRLGAKGYRINQGFDYFRETQTP
ncbi:MAG: glycosyltransferase, partial [Oscillospiraceae bacterium]|nr:glycosyltransferase [Oscillospiraceae bacterium]